MCHDTLSYGHLKPNRDRKGALPRTLIHVHRHWITLTISNVSNRSFDVVPIPQIPCTPMPRPSAPFRRIQPNQVQPPAGVSLELVQDLLRRHRCVNDNVHVISSTVRNKQPPVPVLAVLFDCIQDTSSSKLIHFIRLLKSFGTAQNTLAQHWVEPTDALECYALDLQIRIHRHAAKRRNT